MPEPKVYRLVALFDMQPVELAKAFREAAAALDFQATELESIADAASAQAEILGVAGAKMLTDESDRRAIRCIELGLSFKSAATSLEALPDPAP